ncbi:MAG: hypothetical protein AAF849_24490 [Bacteroidota bacterium]
MEFQYLEDFSKTTVNNMELVQTALKETGATIDTKLFPLIEEAENDNALAQYELHDMFVYGLNNVKPNYKMAERYFNKIQDANIAEGDSKLISEGMKAKALFHHEFGEDSLASTALLDCFKYMVSNLEPIDWDSEVIALVSENFAEWQEGIRENEGYE